VYRLFFIGKILLEGTGFCRNSHFPAGLVSRGDVTLERAPGTTVESLSGTGGR
jgi:hypothetical protein